MPTKEKLLKSKLEMWLRDNKTIAKIAFIDKPERRKVFELWFYGGISQINISKMLNKTPPNVNALIKLAIKQLQKANLLPPNLK